MQYIINEIKTLYLAFINMMAFYIHPRWLLQGIVQHENTIEHAMLNVKKSIALMIIIITVLSLLFSGFEFVQDQEKPGEIFAVLLVHGALVSVIIAVMAWLALRNHQQVGLLMGWLILVYWVPLWIWNMLFEIHAGFNGEKYTNLFLQIAHAEVLLDWHLYMLALIWLHATVTAIYGLYHMFQVRSAYLWVLGLFSSALYLLSFMMLHRTQKGVEIIYLIFGMG